jgi:ATP-dependent helicase/nuclease subunit B
MNEDHGPSLYNIPVHFPFADALASGLIDQHKGDPLALARGTILLPNNRAITAVRNAFVRRSEKGLLLPRLVVIGDPELRERAGSALDPADADPIRPAIDPLKRQFMMAGWLQNAGIAKDGAQAMALAADLGGALDALTIERTSLSALPEGFEGNLSDHWKKTLQQLAVINQFWPGFLDDEGAIDLAERRNRQLDRLADRWRETPPIGFVIAAGISTPAPAIAALMRVIARLPQGAVVLAGLDPAMPADQWEVLKASDQERAIENHPQFHLRLLLDRMGFNRDDVRAWPFHGTAAQTKRSARMARVSGAMTPAAFTDRWADEIGRGERLEGISALELATPAEEAQAIALALRHAIEEPGKTAALVTPDRALAARVSMLLRRWGLEADDSAGRPLSHTPPGTLLLSLAEAVAERFAPVPLLALVKHPLVKTGEERQSWLDGARKLDLALRGPRPNPDLGGVTEVLAVGDKYTAERRAKAADWWADAMPLLAPLERGKPELVAQLARLREAAERLAGDRAWAGEAGRQAANLIASIEALSADYPLSLEPASLPILLRSMMDSIPVRPPQGGHPRIFIWGLLEAKLQSADMMILGGLNEGSWPQLQNADPWLAPAVRRALGLPSLERRIGLAAHDLVSAIAAPRVMLTRAKRDASSPTTASRFWLRLQTYTGGLPKPTTRYDLIARALDGLPEKRLVPVWPAPPASDRPRALNVSSVDTLKADPFSFYAKTMLGLSALEPPGGEPDAKWRGTFLHNLLDLWQKEDGCAAGRLVARIKTAFAQAPIHPVVRNLWQPRFEEAAAEFEALVAKDRAEGREPIASEIKGTAQLSGIMLTGKPDRIDRLADGTLAIIDYKTGGPPNAARVGAGYAVQLGLLGWLAEAGAFDGVEGAASTFEYWSQGRAKSGAPYGYRASPTGKKDNHFAAEDMVAKTVAQFEAAAAKWLTGDAPFTAKERPEFTFAEFDHLMRYDEWVGRHD